MEITRGDIKTLLKGIRREEWQEAKTKCKQSVYRNKKKYTRKNTGWRNSIK